SDPREARPLLGGIGRVARRDLGRPWLSGRLPHRTNRLRSLLRARASARMRRRKSQCVRGVLRGNQLQPRLPERVRRLGGLLERPPTPSRVRLLGGGQDRRLRKGATGNRRLRNGTWLSSSKRHGVAIQNAPSAPMLGIVTGPILSNLQPNA